MILFPVANFGLYYAHQTLCLAWVPYRYHESTVDFQLCNQRFRNCWSACRDNDGVVRRVRRPPKCAIKTLNRCVVDSQLTNPRLSFACEIADPLDRENL